MDKQVAWIKERSEPRIFGFDPRGRLARVLERAGVTVVDDLTAVDGDVEVLYFNASFVYEPAFVTHLLSEIKQPIFRKTNEQSELVFARGSVADAGFIQTRMADPSSAVLADEMDLEDIGPIYHGTLRKQQRNLVYALDEMKVVDIEWSLYKGAYKGVTDFFTKYAWPVPAFWLTKLANNLGMSPNMVTSISAFLTVYATYAFYMGDWAVGLICAWGMCILDTVDGKLARVTMTSSKWGNAFDHGIDLIHPPFWYAAWGYGLIHQFGGAENLPFDLWYHLGVIIIGYVLGRICEGIFMLVAEGQDMWTWHKLDSYFRLWVSRRNPNLFLLTVMAAVGEPALGFYFVSLWTIASVAYQVVRILQALIWRMQKKPFISWMTTSKEEF